MEFLYTIFTWLTIISALLVLIETARGSTKWIAVTTALLAFIGAIGTYWTGTVIDHRKDVELAQLQPRQLTEKQENELLELAKEHVSRISFIGEMQNGESIDFANSLSKIFQNAGWDVQETPHMSVLSNTEYVLVFYTNKSLSNDANFVVDTFNKVGVTTRLEAPQRNKIGSLPHADTIYVVVARKSSFEE